MLLHEYQSKKIFSDFSIPVPKGIVVSSKEEAIEGFKKLNLPKVAMKVQVHAGGRGKAGGIKIVSSPLEASEFVEKFINKKFITYQTGPDGRIVRKILIEEPIELKKEFYTAVVLDRSVERPAVLFSTEGGMDIEEIAKSHPDKIFKEIVNPHIGMESFQARKICKFIPFNEKVRKSVADILIKLVKIFITKDLSLVEINPLGVCSDERVIAVDAKINIDDRALFRHPDIAELRDEEQEDRLELEASKAGISYVSLDGNIGCMVNGAGLAMSTMDLIKLHGGMPANFLDVGGGANKEQVIKAFKILLSNKNVKAILINIFGGIMKCDVIAQGVVEAAKEVNLNLPLVVRLEGTNVQLGKQILAQSNLPIISANNMNDAAKKVVELAKS